MKLLPLWASIVFLVVGVLLVAVGLIIFFITPGLIESRVIEAGVVDSPNHSEFENWRKPPENPLVFNCFFWNISNIADVRNGTENGDGRPNLQIAGPYVYKRFQERFDVTFLNNDDSPCSDGCPRVQYREWGNYVYYPDESNNRSQNDTVYVPNVAYMTLLAAATLQRTALGAPIPKQSEEFLAIEASRDLLFGEFVRGFTDPSLEVAGYPDGLTPFGLSFYSGLGPLVSLGAIVQGLVIATSGSMSPLIAQSVAVGGWALCEQGLDIQGGGCPNLFTFLSGVPGYSNAFDPAVELVLSSTTPNFRSFRINVNSADAADSFAKMLPSNISYFWDSTEAYSLANPLFQPLWTSPDGQGATYFVGNWTTLFGIDPVLAVRVASWRAPSVPNFGPTAHYLTLFEPILIGLFWNPESYPGNRTAWGFLHWGRFGVPNLLPNIANVGILNGASLALDPATAASTYNQRPEINFFAEDNGLPQVHFTYAQSLAILTNFATSTDHIFGHIYAWETLVEEAGGDEQLVIWPGSFDGSPRVPTASATYSLTSVQARILYHYIKTFYLTNIVDQAIIDVFGFPELPNALFRSTPYQQLFGRNDPLFGLLAAGGIIPSGFVNGVWTDFNQTDVGFDPFTLDKYSTGKDDPETRGQQLTYETKTNLRDVLSEVGTNGRTYDSPRYFEIDVDVKGSSLTFVGPYRLEDNKNDENLFLWVPNVFRDLKLIYSTKRKLKGIEVNRYIADRTYSKVAQSPPGEFDNPFNFVMDGRRGYTFGALSLYFTFPHFTYVEETDLFVDPLDGDLQPDEAEYTLFWDIEPITGLAFAARAPLQIAIYTGGAFWNESNWETFIFDRWSRYITRDTYIPVYYITRTNELTDDQAEEWKSTVGLLTEARIAVLAAGLAVGIVLIIVGAIFLILKAKAGKGDMDEFELRT